MATRIRAKAGLKGKTRLRSEIVEAMQGLNKIGAVSDADLAKTTLRLLGPDAALKLLHIIKARRLEVMR